MFYFVYVFDTVTLIIGLLKATFLIDFSRLNSLNFYDTKIGGLNERGHTSSHQESKVMSPNKARPCVWEGWWRGGGVADWLRLEWPQIKEKVVFNLEFGTFYALQTHASSREATQHLDMKSGRVIYTRN